MNIKTTLTVIILLIFFTTAFAQNTTMAKAFYKKAQKAYVKKEYNDVITFVEKAKEYLGATNPDIIYLEAKARFEKDLNINKTKKLLNQFINDAPQDSRIEEVADLLADIETSNQYYHNGLRKKSIHILSDGRKRTIYYNELYEESGSYNDEYINDDKHKTKIIYYYVGGLKNFEEVYLNNIIFSQTLFYGFLTEDKSTLKTKRYCKAFFDENTLKKEHIKLLQSGGKDGLEKEQFVDLYINKKYTNEMYFFNLKSGKKSQWYSEKDKYFVVNNTKGEDLLKLRNSYAIDYYKIESEFLPFSKFYPNRMVKILRQNISSKEYFYYYFDTDGMPEKKEFYKKKKLRETYIYNIENRNWQRQ